MEGAVVWLEGHQAQPQMERWQAVLQQDDDGQHRASVWPGGRALEYRHRRTVHGSVFKSLRRYRLFALAWLQRRRLSQRQCCEAYMNINRITYFRISSSIRVRHTVGWNLKGCKNRLFALAGLQGRCLRQWQRCEAYMNIKSNLFQYL